MNNRKQFVKISSNNSRVQNVTCGVPQGSIIGPLLFLIYVNDMVDSVKYGKVKIFADDTNMFYTDKDIHSIIPKIEEDLSALNDWLKVNKLCLNVKKCNFMIIHSSHKKKPTDIKIKLCDNYIEEVEFCKYLGVYIDNKLTWKNHITAVCKKIRPIIGILSKVRYFIPVHLLRSIYYSLVHPHIQYCIETWGAAYTSYLKPLVLLHKKCIRIISFVSPYDHTKPLYENMNILPLHKLYFQTVCLVVYKELNYHIPIKFDFTLCSDVHSYNTRSSVTRQLHSFSHNTNHYGRSIVNMGTKCFNLLPSSIIESKSIAVFKNRIKKWLNLVDVNIDALISCNRTIIL